MEDYIKILNKMKMFCSICDEEHDVELFEYEKDEKIRRMKEYIY